MIRRFVTSVSGARLTIVGSKEALLGALDEAVPELLLLPALLRPADESELLRHIRSLSDARHLQVLVTPHPVTSGCNVPEKNLPLWRRWLSTGASPVDDVACDSSAFAGRLRWALRRADEARRLFGQSGFDRDPSSDDRRIHRRFRAETLQWLQLARIKDGPQVTLLDLSAGGVLLETDIRLQPDREIALELIAEANEWVFPFRVVRSRLGGGLMYRTGCAFTEPFDIDDLMRMGKGNHRLLTGSVLLDAGDPAPREEHDPSTSTLTVTPVVRQSEGHCERDERRTANDVPWLSNVRLPWGLEVDLLNISRTGMLVETNAKFMPGAETEFQLSGPETSLAVPARFVRSEVSEVTSRGVRYRAAARFTKKVRFPGVSQPGETPRALADLLTQVLGDPNRGSDQTALRTLFCQRLSKLVPARDIGIVDAPTKTGDGAEAIYFTVPSVTGPPAVLQATFEADHHLDESEFKMLRGAAALAAVVLEFERNGH